MKCAHQPRSSCFASSTPVSFIRNHPLRHTLAVQATNDADVRYQMHVKFRDSPCLHVSQVEGFLHHRVPLDTNAKDPMLMSLARNKARHHVAISVVYFRVCMYQMSCIISQVYIRWATWNGEQAEVVTSKIVGTCLTNIFGFDESATSPQPICACNMHQCLFSSYVIPDCFFSNTKLLVRRCPYRR